MIEDFVVTAATSNSLSRQNRDIRKTEVRQMPRNGYLAPPGMQQFLKLRHGAKWHDSAEAKGLPYVFAKYRTHGKAQTLPSRRYAESVLLAVSFGAYDTTSPCPAQARFWKFGVLRAVDAEIDERRET